MDNLSFFSAVAEYPWLFSCVVAYWGYCFYVGQKNQRTVTAKDFFIAGGSLPWWVFMLAATATTFSGWTFMGNASLIYENGLQCFIAFYALAGSFTGVLFLKRQWMLGKRYHFITPGEMFSTYFQSTHFMRWLVLTVALAFSLFYLAVQLYATGFLFETITNHQWSATTSMILLSVVVIIYAGWGGLRAVAYVDIMQAILLAGGMVFISFVIFFYYYTGSWTDWNTGVATLAQFDYTRTTEGYSHYLAVPGAFQNEGTGGKWTGLYNLTYLFALMGIQASPAFTMWAFSNQTPKPFSIQQVWISSFLMGFILVVLVTFQGFSGHLLGANPEFWQNHSDELKDHVNVLNDSESLNSKLGTLQERDQLVPMFIYLMTNIPWIGNLLVGIIAVCALAAIQSTAAPYISTFAGVLTRDIFKHYIPTMTDSQQIVWGRLSAIVIAGLALILAIFAKGLLGKDGLGELGGLAVAYGSQMWPALIGICWRPFFTRQGIITGLIAGIVAVTLTNRIVAEWLGWGWVKVMHPAGWGILLNFGLVVIVSCFTQDENAAKHRVSFHHFLTEHTRLPDLKRRWVPIAWAITLGWLIFAIGPGAVIGNDIFGNPNNYDKWDFGIPSLWAWQILGWVTGVAMMWFLASYLEMSTEPKKPVVPLPEHFDNKGH